MRILVTGAHGLLGQKTALIAAQESAHEILLTDLDPTSIFGPPRFEYEQLDVTRASDVKSLVSQYRPDVIIHTAAMTDVDACETEREQCWRVNVDAVKHLLVAARKLEGCHFIHISSDYVFDGERGSYDETCRPNPISYYGKSKLASENAVVASGVSATIVRTQILYGAGYRVRKNFVTWVLSMLEKNEPFRVVNDQVGSPTFVDDLAYALLRIAERKTTGLFHISGPEAVDRWTFARNAATVFGFNPELILQTTTSEIGQTAHRPKNSSFVILRFETTFGLRMCGTMEGLRRFFEQHRDGTESLQDLFARKPS
ncbi:MAG: dTDP-4-dehydrorhamnose reductase [Bacteroidota bacterium]|nr:dTDP-4-dehydrorhamnose reductase [Bacteroidota bacterium]